MFGRLVISRAHNPSPAQSAHEEALARAVSEAGAAVLLTPDLYHLPAGSPLWQRLAELPAPVVYAGWLQARALGALLATHGLGAPAAVVALQAQADPAQVASELVALTGTAAPPGTCEALDEATSDRWYPVIDTARCTRCGQCFQFCLFGVYERNPDGTVRVAQPDSCKAGCPACSRICPESAIMFPLFVQDPAICGAPGCFVTRDPDAADQVRQRARAKAASEPQAPVLDEIDALISQLDELSELDEPAEGPSA